ncbi:DUF3679 domain-containing protein [Thalassobacillus devorans]|uniref:DUF3679 domain-containing protein n=1 Tax=Thalassobacillus devorans TaxID=279813 RepID=UPI00048A45D6|nr:DUF3679 domain-containing protein [Thalassobacillus devorans]
MLKYLLLLCMMIILFLGGALFGLKQGGEGVIQTSGYTTEHLNEGLVIEQVVNDKYDTPVLGIPIEQQNIDANINTYKNQAAHSSVQLAELLGGGVSKIYDVVITVAANMVEPLF